MGYNPISIQQQLEQMQIDASYVKTIDVDRYVEEGEVIVRDMYDNYFANYLTSTHDVLVMYYISFTRVNPRLREILNILKTTKGGGEYKEITLKVGDKILSLTDVNKTVLTFKTVRIVPGAKERLEQGIPNPRSNQKTNAGRPVLVDLDAELEEPAK